jgi:excisionase family DNA binding protein
VRIIRAQLTQNGTNTIFKYIRSKIELRAYWRRDMQKNGVPMAALLDVMEVAAFLKVSRRKMDAMLKEGSAPPYVQMGGVRRWRQQDIDRWLDQKVQDKEETQNVG